MDLCDKNVCVAIDDYPWEAIAFGVNQAIGIGLLRVKYLSKLGCTADTPAEKIAVDGFLNIVCQDTNCYIRPRIIVTASNKLSSR